MLVFYLPAWVSCAGEGDPECRIHKKIGSQRKKNGTFKGVMQLCVKVITEIMENGDIFSHRNFSCIFTFSVGRVLSKSLDRIFSLSSAVGKQN